MPSVLNSRGELLRERNARSDIHLGHVLWAKGATGVRGGQGTGTGERRNELAAVLYKRQIESQAIG